MNLDDLKTTWQQEITINQSDIDFSRIQQSAEQFDRAVTRGVWIELFACTCLILLSVGFFIIKPDASWMMRLSSLALILVAIFIAIKLVRGRSTSTPDNWTLASNIQRQIEKREKEYKLLSSSANWYLFPLFVVIIASSWSGHAHRVGSWLPDQGLLLYWLACVVLYLGIWWMNKHRAHTKVKPILTDLYRLREELGSE